MTPAYMDSVGNWKHYGSQRLQTLLRINSPAEVAHLNASFRDFVNRHAANDFGPDKPDTVLRMSVAPLTSIHLSDPKTRNVYLAWSRFAIARAARKSRSLAPGAPVMSASACCTFLTTYAPRARKSPHVNTPG